MSFDSRVSFPVEVKKGAGVGTEWVKEMGRTSRSFDVMLSMAWRPNNG